MHVEIEGAPAFSHIRVRLEPGEALVAESGAMVSMDAGLHMKATFFGSFFQALLRKIFGGESLFASQFSNPATEPQSLVLTQNWPGDVRGIALSGNAICMEPGAFVAATPSVCLSARWAGFASWFGGEGLFKLMASGQGTVWVGAYGAMAVRKVEGELCVDSGHIVSYSPSLKLSVGLAGGVFSSFFGGEGFVTRVRGRGEILIQSRSPRGLAQWINKQY